MLAPETPPSTVLSQKTSSPKALSRLSALHHLVVFQGQAFGLVWESFAYTWMTQPVGMPSVA
jgi:hypothetical protein